MRFAASVMLVLLTVSAGRCLAGEQPSMSRGAWSADLDVLYGQMKSLHPQLHHRTDAATMDAYVKRLHREIPHDSWPRFVMSLYRLLAMVGDGHTAFYPPPDAGPGFDTRYPFLPATFSDGLYVTAAAPAYADAVGARILAIGGHPVADVFRTATDYWSHENEGWVERWLPLLLRRPGYLSGMEIVPADVSMPLTLSLEKNGKRFEVRLEPVSAPEDAAGMNTSWIHARDEATVPKLTQSDGPDGDRPNDFVYLKDQKAVYAVYNCVCDSKTETVAAFAKRLFDFVEKNAPDKLIIDVSGNGGGDNYLNQPLLLGMIRAQLVDRPGHLFILTGPHTFSAAQNFADQSERWTQALFVGEPTGSAPNVWGDAKQIELPQTKLHPMIATLYWQDSDPRDRRVWILPDLPASDTFADWVAGRDRALEAALAYKSDDAPPAEAPDKHWRRPSQQRDWRFHF